MRSQNILMSLADRLPHIERVVWARAKAKRCSYAPRGSSGYPKELSSLGIEVRDWAICSQDWPSMASFLQMCPPSHGSADGANGLYLDIPHCCATHFQEVVGRHDTEYFRAHPCQGSVDGWPRSLEEMNQCPVGPYPELDEITQHIRHGISNGTVDQNFSLLAWMYVPCRVDCERFADQSQRMRDALFTFLPTRAQSIIEQYVAETLNPHD